MVILGYEVEANLDMTGDGHIGGYKLFVKKLVLYKEKQQ